MLSLRIISGADLLVPCAHVKYPISICRNRVGLTAGGIELFYLFLVHFVDPKGNSGGFPQGKPATTESRYPTLNINYKVHAGSFPVSVTHRTLIMDYMILNVRTVRDRCYVGVYNTGVGHTDKESAQHFDSDKLSPNFLALLTGFEPRIFRSRVRRSTK